MPKAWSLNKCEDSIFCERLASSFVQMAHYFGIYKLAVTLNYYDGTGEFPLANFSLQRGFQSLQLG